MMKIEVKLGNSADIVYGNCPAVFSRLGVTCETSCNVGGVWYCTLMIVSYKPGNLVYPCIYEKETFPRYALGKLLDREKNAEELKVSSRHQVLRLRAGVVEMIAFETRATSFRNVIRANTNITSSIFHGKSGISPVTLQIKRNFSVKLEISRGLSLCTAWTSDVRSVNNSSNVKFPPVGEVSCP